MIIGVQKGLERLGSELWNRGFDVTVADGRECRVDAFIYRRDEMRLVDIIKCNRSIKPRSGCAGVFLVDSKGKSTEEVERVLRERTYSPLF